MSRTDVQTRQDVLDQIRWDDRVSSADVSVEARDGVVTLGGCVPTYTARQAAEEDAWDIAGVREVRNELEVRWPHGAPAADDEVLAGVQAALRANADVDERGIMVSASGGVVTLDGTVDAYWKRRVAGQIVGQVVGVVSIENNLMVDRATSRSDSQIAAQLRRALMRNTLVDESEIDVEVDGAVVTLSGSVESWRAYKAAMNAAAYTPGVADVVDELEIVETALVR